jgi:dihydrofolate reductase
MRQVVVNEFMSLDGVVQAPGTADEDASGGFRHGGWHMRYFDDVSQKWVLQSIVEAGGFLLGRRTYEIFAAYWPNAPEEEQVIAEPLNTKPKYVASTTLTEPLEWKLDAAPGRRRRGRGRAAAGGRRGCAHDRQHGVGPDADRA